MHDDLQLREHNPHFVHLSLLNVGLKIEYKDTTPKNVPTGQMLLHHQRPFFTANTPNSINIPMDKANVNADFMIMSTL